MELPDKQIHLYFCRSEALLADSEYLESLLPLLDAEEQARWRRFIPEQKRREFLLAHALVRWVLSQYSDVAPQDWQFTKNTQGKPAVANPGHEHLHFNLSHTAGLQIVALARGCELGVDVECRDTKVEGRDIARRFFSEAEVEELFGFPSAQHSTRFFDYWSLKESYIKARGMGLAIPLAQFSFALGGESIGISFAPELQDSPASWQFWLLEAGASQSCALGIKSGQALDLRAWDAVPQRQARPRDVVIRQSTETVVTP